MVAAAAAAAAEAEVSLASYLQRNGCLEGHDCELNLCGRSRGKE